MGAQGASSNRRSREDFLLALVTIDPCRPPAERPRGAARESRGSPLRTRVPSSRTQNNGQITQAYGKYLLTRQSPDGGTHSGAWSCGLPSQFRKNFPIF